MKLKCVSMLAASVCAAPLMFAQPTIQAAVNAASYTSALAPGTLASIFGTGLASGTAGATSVTVGGIACPLTYVSPGQVNFVIPFEVATLNPSQTIAAPVVVTTPAGASVAFAVTLSRNAPGIFTQNGAGSGGALVFDANFNPATSIGTAPIILYATGLGPTAPEPLNPAVDAVTVLIGENPAQVLFAGLAPGFPGVYQINVVPQGPISNRVAIVVNQRQSNVATVPIPVGTNVANVSGAISGLYPVAGGLQRFSEILFAGKLTLGFDILPGAKAFQIVARTSGGADVLQEVIDIDPVSGVYSLLAPSPTTFERQGNFARINHTVFDFMTGTPVPNNIIPASLLDPIALTAANSIPLPNATASIGDNGSWMASGNLSSLTHFDIGAIPGASNFGGFTAIAQQHGGSLTASFELLVDGLLVSSQNVSFPVD